MVPVLYVEIFVDMELVFRAEEVVDHRLRGHIYPSMFDVPPGPQHQLNKVLHLPREPPVEAARGGDMRESAGRRIWGSGRREKESCTVSSHEERGQASQREGDGCMAGD